ncbi:MAG: hypothetical protein AAFW87_02070 [Pseudomonadota bacterium]
MTEDSKLSKDEIEALLVFLANDTLEGDERAEVEAAVAADPQLAGELEALKAMRNKMQAEEVVPSPGELGLARLLRDIEAETAAPSVPVAANSPTAPGFWKVAAVVLFGLVVAQTAYFGYTRGPEMELAGGQETSVTADHTIRVAFSSQATESDIRTLLLDLELVIVDGPSAIGLYTLAAIDHAARAQALITLQSRSDIIETAE